jgi:hypothetical protein
MRKQTNKRKEQKRGTKKYRGGAPDMTAFEKLNELMEDIKAKGIKVREVISMQRLNPGNDEEDDMDLQNFINLYEDAAEKYNDYAQKLLEELKSLSNPKEEYSGVGQR